MDVTQTPDTSADLKPESAIFAEEKRPNTISYLQERVPILVDDTFTTL